MKNLDNLPSGSCDINGKLVKTFKVFPSGYSIGNYLIYDKEVEKALGTKFCTIKGNNLPTGNDKSTYKFHGKWIIDKRGNPVFDSKYTELKTSDKAGGIITMLSSDKFPGVGKMLAIRMYSKFGKSIWDVIENEPDKLCQVKGIDSQKAQDIHESFLLFKGIAPLAKYLSRFDISGTAVEKIYDTYGPAAVDKVKANPYCMIEDVRGVGFDTCDKIGRGMYSSGEKPDILSCDERVKAGILYSLKKQCDVTGGLYVEGNDLYKISEEKLNAGIVSNNNSKPVSLQKWKTIFSNLTEDGTLVDRRFHVRGATKHLIFSNTSDKAERTVAYKFLGMKRRTSGLREAVVRQEVKKYSDRLPHPLSAQQQEACVQSLHYAVSIITGGPGTGKTTILKCIISVYQKLTGEDVTCMAPTGKAARRMSESTGLPASTIHSRLGLANTGLAVNLHGISGGLVIIDEVSMVDQVLMANVAEALDNRCHLVLVGDVDQLPSVGSGAVLSQMIQSGCIPTARLTETFRQAEGSIIIENAKAVNEGRPHDIVYNNEFQFVDAGSEVDAVEKIKELFKAEVDRVGIDNVALLSPLRNDKNGAHPCSSDGMNPVLQELFNPGNDKPSLHANKTDFKVDDRVMKWSNGPKSANGDTGVVEDVIVSKGMPALVIRWDNGNTEIIRKLDLDSLTLAYSMSVHKSQGSEYDTVIIPVLWSQRCPLFRRNLLYTGITRAKKKVILVGDKRAIYYMCTHADENKRNTLLKTRLIYNDRAYQWAG